jgi:hypothetical protein
MRRQRISKAFVIAAALLMVAACGGNAPVASRAESFVVIQEDRSADPGTITVSIKVGPQSAESEIKASAEAAISRYTTEYRSVTVKSFRAGDRAGEIPLAVSTFEDGQVRHTFNSQAGPQKIPTH